MSQERDQKPVYSGTVLSTVYTGVRTNSIYKGRVTVT